MMMGVSALTARISFASSTPVISGIVWSVMTRSNLDGSFFRSARASRAVHPGCHLVAEFREDVLTHLHKGLFVIDEEDALGAGGKLVVADRIGFRCSRNLREIYAEGGSFAGFTLNRDVAVVLLHNAVDDGETETRPFSEFLCGEEGVEYLFHDIGRDAGARIADSQLHVKAGLDPVGVAI